MRNWFFIAILITLFFAGFLYSKKTADKIPPPEVLSAAKAPTITPSAWKQSTVIDVEGIPVRISWAIADPEQVKLFSNLKEQEISEEIKIDKSCSILVNGGFYSKENAHLGLFISNYEAISNPIQSALFNGFLWIESDNASINSHLPDVNPRLALQSGPLLMQNGKPLLLDINNDEPNRRIVAAVTPDNKLIFLSAYYDGSKYQGPLLGQLPEIINLFKKQTGVDIVNAINLDGGSASVFISNYDRLNELTHIGSYFCVK